MRVLVACASLWLVACGSSPRIGGGGGIAGCPAMNGILLIDWTVRGQAASTASCAGVANITLYLDSQQCGQVSIEPIECAMDKLRYDHLPEGPGEVLLQGSNVRGAPVVSGSAMVNLTATLPAQPTTVPLE